MLRPVHAIMPCKKSQLIAAINAYATARSTSDQLLMQAAIKILQPLVDSLEFMPESDEPAAGELTEEAA